MSVPKEAKAPVPEAAPTHAPEPAVVAPAPVKAPEPECAPAPVKAPEPAPAAAPVKAPEPAHDDKDLDHVDKNPRVGGDDYDVHHAKTHPAPSQEAPATQTIPKEPKLIKEVKPAPSSEPSDPLPARPIVLQPKKPVHPFEVSRPVEDNGNPIDGIIYNDKPIEKPKVPKPAKVESANPIDGIIGNSPHKE